MKYDNIQESIAENGIVTLIADCRLGKNEIIFQGSQSDLEKFNERNAIVYLLWIRGYVQNINLARQVYDIEYPTA